MKYNDLITPVGTKDYLFYESGIKREISHKLSDLYKTMGYSEIMTPGIEFYDVFDQNSHYFPQEKMLKLTDDKNRLLVLRPDSTIPIARVVSTRLKNALLPLRLFYNQPVFRHVQELKGKSVEVEQIGIEMIGSSSDMADIEVVSAAVDSLSACCDNFNIELGHAAIYNEIISQIDISDDKKEEIRSLIESKNHPMLDECLSKLGNSKTTELLRELPNLFGGREVFEKARKLMSNNVKLLSIIENLEYVYNIISKIMPEEHLSVDLAMVHKTDYYTGIMIRGYLDGYGREVLSGGRYDKLLSEFDYDIPAIGFAVNIDAITKVKCRNSVLNESNAPDVLICAAPGKELQALKVAREYRQKGLITEFSLFNDKESLVEYSKEKKIGKMVMISDDGVTED